jgi:hypothetical protein
MARIKVSKREVIRLRLPRGCRWLEASKYNRARSSSETETDESVTEDETEVDTRAKLAAVHARTTPALSLLLRRTASHLAPALYNGPAPMQLCSWCPRCRTFGEEVCEWCGPLAQYINAAEGLLH